MNDSSHSEFMRRALTIAERNPKYPFGAVIVDQRTNTVVAEGWNQGEENPLWHGEVVALNELFSKGKPKHKSELTLYTTAEPCPMCQSAIIWAGIDHVVFGTSIATLKRLGWNQIDIESTEVASRSPFHRCDITGGVLEAECDAMFVKAQNKR